MKVVVTGATGLIGRQLVERLRQREDSIVALSRDAENAGRALGPDVDIRPWQAVEEPAPVAALSGADAVVNLSGEPVDQRWTAEAKRKIHDSRVIGTRNLVKGLEQAQPRPEALVSASAVGYYGPRGDEVVDESAPPANDFLAGTCKEWEAEARKAEELGIRVVLNRTGIVLSSAGGALKRMLLPFKLGLGGPVGSGTQYMAWVHIDDVVGLILAALDDRSYSGPLNVTAPNPVTNKEFSKSLGKALSRPAMLPTPALMLGVFLGEFVEVVTTGARVVPTRAKRLGYRFKWTDVESALRDVVSGPSGN